MTPELLSFGVLGLAILSLWVAAYPVVWKTVLTFAVALALASGVMTISGLGFAFAAGGSIYAYYQVPCSNRMKIVLAVLMSILTLGLFGHLFPGFRDVTLLSNTVLVSGAYPTSIIWSFDKPLAGLMLMLWGVKRLRGLKEWRRILPTALRLYAVCAVLISAVAIALRVLAWSPHWLHVSWLFAVGNLFFVCVPEEAFFRGFLQRRITERLATKTWGKPASLAIASVIFGVCHFAGGLGLMLSATAAGLFYGAAYQRTGRVEAAIIVHFLLNLAHFTLFTYPALRQ